MKTLVRHRDAAVVLMAAILGISVASYSTSLKTASGNSYYYYNGGAYSDDRSAIPNVGVRAVLDVSPQPGPTGSSGHITPYISDDISNDIWIRTGYTATVNELPNGFYEIWNLNSNRLLASGLFPVLRGPHEFSIYLKNGTTWAVSYDEIDETTYDAHSSISSSSYPIYSMVEVSNSVQSMYTFYTINFPIAMQVVKSKGQDWVDVAVAKSYGGAFTAQGQIQAGGFLPNQIVVGKYLQLMPTGTTLWNISAHAVVASNDNVPPTITVPSTIIEYASNDSGVNVDYEVSAIDDQGAVASGPTCTIASGSLFPLGATTVDCTAKDASGNTARASFTVVVLRESATASPMFAFFTYPSNGAVVSGTLTATVDTTSDFGIQNATLYVDNQLLGRSVDTPAVFTVPTGSLVDGPHLLKAIVVDEAGNNATTTASITVQNTPVINQDNITQSNPVTNSSGGNPSGNSSSSVSSDPPTITVPTSMTAEATSAAGASVSYTVTAEDSSGANVDATCTPSSGSNFAIGSTTVHCSATDSGGLSSSQSFTVTVQDTTAPTVAITSPTDGSTVSGTETIAVQADDNTGIQKVDIFVDGKLKTTITTAPYSFDWNAHGLKQGTHTISATATDLYGHQATASISVSK